MEEEAYHSQLLDIPTAVPFALACKGRISGTYTHGMQFALAPKMSMSISCQLLVFFPLRSKYSQVKKKAILAELVD